MKKMKKVTAVALAVAMMASMAACGQKETKETAAQTEAAKETTKETVKETAKETTKETESKAESETKKASALSYDKIIIGVDDTFAPMGFRDDKNEMTGFDIELAKAVAKQMGVEVDFQVIDWSMKETELNQKNIDVIWNGYTITDERKEKVAFTKAYLDNTQCVVVLKDSDIKTLADLADKTVAVQVDSSALEAVQANADVAASLGDLVQFSTNDECLMDLEAGRSDAVVADSVLVNYYISQKQNPDEFVVLGEDFGSEEYGIGVRKEDTDLLNAIQTAMDECIKDGTAASISEKWFGTDIVKK